MTRIVVTGAGGGLGSALATALAGLAGAEVTGFVRHRPAPASVARSLEVELTDAAAVTSALADVEPVVVVHAGGRVHGSTPELFRDNAAATAVVADSVLAACPDALVIALGSAAEYGRPAPGTDLIGEDAPCRPLSPYGHSKLAAARYLDAAAGRGLAYDLIRVFNPVGRVNSTDQVVGAFMARALAARSAGMGRVVMGRLDAVRDYVVVDDIARLVLRLVEAREAGHVVNACSGEGRRVRDVVAYIAGLAGGDIEIVEEGPPPRPDAPPDRVVGDPTRFLALAGIESLTPLEETLATAWSLMEGRGR